MKGIKKLLISSLVAFMAVSNSAFIALAEDSEPKQEEPKQEQVVEPVQEEKKEEVVDEHNYIYYLVDGTTIHFSNSQSENYTEFDTLTAKDTKEEIPWYNTEIDNVVIDNEIKPTTMAHWFEDTKISEINLENLNTENLVNTNSLFRNCGSLVTIKVKDTFNLDNVTDSSSMFEGCSSIKGQNETTYDEEKTKKEYAVIDSEEHVGYLTDVNYVPEEKEEAPVEITPAMVTTPANAETNDTIYWGINNNVLHFSSTELSSYTPHGTVDKDYNDASEIPWKAQRSTITGVVIDNEIKPTSTAYWFYGFSAITSIDLNNLNTVNTKDMEAMFNGCSKLTSITFGDKFVTTGVTDMSDMFNGNDTLEYLDITNFDTSNVVDMSQMFLNCKKIKTIRVGDNFVTSKVVASEKMFFNCEDIVGGNGTDFYVDKTNKDYARIDKGSSDPGYFTRNYKLILNINTNDEVVISQEIKDVENGAAYGTLPTPSSEKASFNGWYTQASGGNEVTSETIMDIGAGHEVNIYAHWDSIYWGLEALAGGKYKLHLSNSQLSSYTDNGRTSGEFETTLDIPWGVHGLENITDVVIENTIAPKSIGGWFATTAISSIDLSNIDTLNIENMYGVFAYCSNLTTITFGNNFNTSNVKYMSYMFKGCSKLTTLDLSNFNTSNVLEMREMFADCSLLVDLNIKSFDVQKLIYATGMFSGCSQLTELDLTSFVTTNLNYTDSMFEGCSSLRTIYATSGFDNDMMYSSDMFKGCSSLVGGHGTKFDPDYTDYHYACIDGGTSNPGYFTLYNKIEFVDRIDGQLKIVGYADVEKDTSIGVLPAVTKEGYVFDGWYTTKETGGTKIDDEQIYDGTYWTLYARWSPLAATEKIYWGIHDEPYGTKTISVLHLGTKDIYSSYPKHGDTGQTKGIYTSKDNVPWLQAEDSSNKIKYIVIDDALAPLSTAYWFSGLTAVQMMELSNLVTIHTTNATEMFSGCSALTTIYVYESSFVTSGITTSTNMFNGCTNLVGGSGTTYSYFGTKDKTAAIIDYKTNKGLFTDGRYYELTFDFNGGLSKTVRKTVVQGNTYGDAFDDGKLPTPTRLGFEFGGWYTDPVAGEKVDENTVVGRENKTLYAHWIIFYWGINNGTLYLSNNESTTIKSCTKKGHSSGVFSKKESLPWDGEQQNITKVVIENEIVPLYTAFWFATLENVTQFEGLNNINTANTTDMSYMFLQCKKLTSIDVSSFNTQFVADMSYMFSECNALTELDVSGFQMANVYSVSNMFSKMSRIKKINIKSFSGCDSVDASSLFEGDTALVTINGPDVLDTKESDNMFKGCTKLVGGNGTTFDSAKIDATYARCDKQGNTNPGYFTKYNKLNFSTSRGRVSQVCKDISAGSTYGKLPTVVLGSELFCGWYTDPTAGEQVTSNTTMGSQERTVYARFSPLYWGITSTGELHLSAQALDGTFAHSGQTDGLPVKEDGQIDTIAWVKGNTSSIVINKVIIETDIYPTSTGRWFENMSSLTSIINIDKLHTGDVTNMVNMFKGCSSLVNLDVSGFDTSNVNNMRDMFYGCSSLKSLDVSNFDTSSCLNMYQMFGGCSSLTSLNLEKFDTSNVTDMTAMFNQCSNLSEIKINTDLFKIDNVEYASHMFYNCKSLTALDTSKWVSKGKLLDTEYMFANCIKLKELDFTNIDTSKSQSTQYMFGSETSDYMSLKTIKGIGNIKTDSAISVAGMFKNCNVLEGLDPSNLNVDNVTNMARMFENLTKLTSLDLSKWNTSKVTDMSYMFTGCTNLTSIKFNSPTNENTFDTSNVTDMSYMFNNCNNLTQLDLSTFDTSKVKSMNAMFNQCTKLSSITFGSTFNTQLVEYMSYMFQGCSALGSLDLSVFDTTSVKDMQLMFRGCSALSSITFGDNFTASNVTNMSYMFNGCSSLGSLNLSKFDTSKVEYMQWMFDNCSSLKSLDLSNFNTSKVTTMYHMFTDCKSLKELDISNFTAGNNLTSIASMFKRDTSLETIYVSNNFNVTNVSDSDGMFYNCSNIVGGSGTTYSQTPTDKTFAHIDGGTSNPGYFTLKGTHKLIYDLNCNDSSATVIPTLKTVASGAVYGELPTPTRTNYIFRGWYKEKECTNKVDSTTIMGDSETRIYAKWDTIYWGINSSKELHISASPLVGTYNPSGNFDGIVSDALTGAPWTKYSSSINKIVIDGIVTPDETKGWFANLPETKSIVNLSNLDTKNVTSMYGMFAYSGFESLDVSVLDTQNVTDMTGMFTTCSNLSSITFGGKFDTSKVTNMYCMLYGINATTLDISSFNTSNVTNTAGLFKNNKALTTLTLPDNLVTNKVTTTEGMFQGLTSIKEINLKTFDTSGVTDMHDMFRDCPNLETIYSKSSFTITGTPNSSMMFSGDTSLVGGNGTKYSESHITSEYARFDNPTGSSNGYFTQYHKLVVDKNYGGIAATTNDVKEDTILNTILVDLTNTRNPYYFDGWFTEAKGGTKIDTSQQMGNENRTAYAHWHLDANETFYWKRELISGSDYRLLLSKVNGTGWTATNGVFTDYADWYNASEKITEVKVMDEIKIASTKASTANWFKGQDKLTTVDISKLDTSEVTNMESMFDGCSSLTTLNLYNFDTAKVTNMANMFKGCSSLKTIYVSEDFVVSDAVKKQQLFTGCTSLEGGAGSTITKCGTVYGTHAIIDGNGGDGYLTDGKDYKVTFSYDGGSGETSEITRKQGASLGTLPNPTREGFIFDGWYTDPIKGIKVSDSTKMTRGDLALYARWVVFYWGVDNDGTLHLGNTDAYSGYTQGKHGGSQGIFYSFAELPWININQEIKKVKIDTSLPVLTTSGLFANLPNAKSIEDLSNLNTQYVTTMYGMFAYSGFESLDVSVLNTSNVTDMKAMFTTCSNLSSIKFGGTFNTSKVTDMYCMMYGIKAKTIDISSFNTSALTNSAGLFKNNPVLESIELPSTFGSNNLKTTEGMFQDLPEIKEINLKTFVTTNVTDMHEMFRNCPKLETIYLNSGFTITGTPNSSLMFSEDSKLVGGNGTEYKKENVTALYAKLDQGVSGKGYFTNNRKLFYNTQVEGERFGSPICKDVKDGETIGILPSLTRDHYKFNGWYTASTGGTKVENTSVVQSGWKEIYAQWSPNTNTIILDPNNGESTTTTTFTYNEKLPSTVTVPTYLKHKFLGYYYNDVQYYDADGKANQSIIWNDDTGNITLTAKWDDKDLRTVTFYLNDDSEKETIFGEGKYIEDERMSFVDNYKPSRLGYIFGGWYYDKACTNAVDKDNQLVGTTNIKLYAKWTENARTITYSFKGNNDKRNPNKYLVQIGVDKLYPAIWDGYKFLGWYDTDGDYLISKISDTADKAYSLKAKYTYIPQVTINTPTNFIEGKCEDIVIHIDGTGISKDSLDKIVLSNGDYTYTLGSADYKAEKGSLLLTIYKETLNTLIRGSYTLNISLKKTADLEGLQISPINVVIRTADSPTPGPGKKDESCEKVIGPTWHWNNDKGICEDIGVVGTKTK